MKIDFHTHFYPESVAERARENMLRDTGILPRYDATAAGLVQSMHESGISFSVGLTLVNRPKNAEAVNRFARESATEAIIPLLSCHPDEDDPCVTIRKFADLGAKGIKLHPEFQTFSYDELKLKKILDCCMEYNLFVVSHAGADLGCKPPWHTSPQLLALLHKRYCNLTFVFAHLGSWGMWEEVLEYLAGLPVYFDTAMLAGFLSLSLAEKIIRKHGADRVLFGSDFPWGGQQESVRYIEKLNLSDDEREMIFAANASRLLNRS